MTLYRALGGHGKGTREFVLVVAASKLSGLRCHYFPWLTHQVLYGRPLTPTMQQTHLLFFWQGPYLYLVQRASID